jgi:thiamine-phosphate pyrophosphorylase
MRRWLSPALMLITDRTRLSSQPLEEVASLAVEGGVTGVQLREKDLSGCDLYELAMTVRAVVQGRALCFVNDRIDVALLSGADGVHLPERCVPARLVRGLVGEGCFVGRSVHSVEAATAAVADSADYLIAGPVYETTSHPGREPAGPELIRDIAQAVDVPVIAIGGINAARVPEVVEAGADGVAVIGAILDARDPLAAAAALRSALDHALAA